MTLDNIVKEEIKKHAGYSSGYEIILSNLREGKQIPYNILNGILESKVGRGEYTRAEAERIRSQPSHALGPGIEESNEFHQEELAGIVRPIYTELVNELRTEGDSGLGALGSTFLETPGYIEEGAYKKITEDKKRAALWEEKSKEGDINFYIENVKDPLLKRVIIGHQAEAKELMKGRAQMEKMKLLKHVADIRDGNMILDERKIRAYLLANISAADEDQKKKAYCVAGKYYTVQER